ncbi:hypothetical protein ACIOJE_35150 [Kitasatospora sp. NPDC087861]|uniref:hypothetical protein n=1 Tax=Kitasatospora sp. NPDC087861 TaxID=3364070 RepID=UPI0038109A9F
MTTTALYDPATPVEITAAGYEAWAAGREHTATLRSHARFSWPVVAADYYRAAAEAAFEDVIARVQPRPAD